MSDFPDLKLKSLVSFPASVLDGIGIDTVKQNGTYQFNLDFSDFAPPVATVTDPANQNALLWNSVTKQYALTPAAALSTLVNPATAVPLADSIPALVGGSLAYAREDHRHPTTSVHFDIAQSLTAAQQAQARQNIYAAPFDALAYNGLQINGSMEVSQENGTTARTTAGYVVDGTLININGTMIFSCAQVTDAPPGLTNSIKITVTTAEAVLGASDYVSFLQNIEGYRTSRLAFGTANAQPISIGFWTKIHRIGTYSGSIRNGAINRSYPFTFIQNVADTWEYKTVTIPGDVTGTWIGNTNGIGLTIFFSMAAGTALTTAAGTWAAGNFLGATGTTNGVAALTDTFQITGLVVLPGIEAPSAARSPFIMRPFDQELMTCQRYFEKSYDYETIPGTATNVGMVFSTAIATGATNAGGYVAFSVTKRGVPTVTFYSGTGVAGQFSNDFAGTTSFPVPIGAGALGKKGFSFYNSGTAANIVGVHYKADARL